MSKEKNSAVKGDAYQVLKSLYYSGKVKPTLNKILVEIEKDSKNLNLTLLACQCLVRTKNFDDLSLCADVIIESAPENAEGYFYKGVALQHKKGKEQEAIKNFNEALVLDPDNTVYLKSKASTHLLLFKDYDLPVKFAEKHKVKAQDNLSKVIELIEQKEKPDYIDYLTIANANVMNSRFVDGKKYFIRAVDAFETAEEPQQDLNILKDIIKAQKACIKEMEKFSE